MKKHSKIGNRPGRPAYRTPALFKYRKHIEVSKIKSRERVGTREK